MLLKSRRDSAEGLEPINQALDPVTFPIEGRVEPLSAVRTGSPWRYMSGTLQGSIESGERSGYDGHKRKKGTKTHMAVEIALVDQGYTGDRAAEDAATHGIELQAVKHPEVKKGFVLLPRRWVVERSFGWMNRFRRLARDYERLPQTLAGLHFVAFATLMLGRWCSLLASA